MNSSKNLKKRIKDLEATIQQLVVQRNNAQIDAAMTLLAINPENAEEVKNLVGHLRNDRIDMQLAVAEAKGKIAQLKLRNAALSLLLEVKV